MKECRDKIRKIIEKKYFVANRWFAAGSISIWLFATALFGIMLYTAWYPEPFNFGFPQFMLAGFITVLLLFKITREFKYQTAPTTLIDSLLNAKDKLDEANISLNFLINKIPDDEKDSEFMNHKNNLVEALNTVKNSADYLADWK